jgi:hypothetical protein
MTKSIDAFGVPSRTVALLSDSEGAYGIGINPSAWVKSFICDEHCHVWDQRIEEKVEELVQGFIAL